MTESEQKTLDITTELWSSFLDLEVLHADDIHEMRRDIHNIQNRIMSRPERRKQNNPLSGAIKAKNLKLLYRDKT